MNNLAYIILLSVSIWIKIFLLMQKCEALDGSKTTNQLVTVHTGCNDHSQDQPSVSWETVGIGNAGTAEFFAFVGRARKNTGLQKYIEIIIALKKPWLILPNHTSFCIQSFTPATFTEELEASFRSKILTETLPHRLLWSSTTVLLCAVEETYCDIKNYEAGILFGSGTMQSLDGDRDSFDYNQQKTNQEKVFSVKPLALVKCRISSEDENEDSKLEEINLWAVNAIVFGCTLAFLSLFVVLLAKFCCDEEVAFV